MDKIHELSAQAMQYWGKLKPDDFLSFQGDLEDLKTKVQKAYSYTQEEIDDEFKAFLKRLKRRQPDLNL
jgi:uncharacterized protein YjbJ (UPF0337 family)